MQIISFFVVQCLKPWKGKTCTNTIHDKIALILHICSVRHWR